MIKNIIKYPANRLEKKVDFLGDNFRYFTQITGPKDKPMEIYTNVDKTKGTLVATFDHKKILFDDLDDVMDFVSNAEKGFENEDEFRSRYYALVEMFENTYVPLYPLESKSKIQKSHKNYFYEPIRGKFEFFSASGLDLKGKKVLCPYCLKSLKPLNRNNGFERPKFHCTNCNCNWRN